jgi:hypothetical protein
VTRAVLVSAWLLASVAVSAEPVPVHHVEGLIHGFLSFFQDGKAVARGDVLQHARGDVVTCRMSIRFQDGSSSEETTVFRQRTSFHLVSDHLVQKGPFFKTPLDVLVDGATGDVTVKYTEKGEEKTLTERLDPLPDDLANGLVGVVIKSVREGTPKTTLSLLIATPKPRVVKLDITPDGSERLAIGGRRRKVAKWRVKMVLGGLAGVLAPILGKEPPDSYLWVLYGEAPTFLAAELALAAGTPQLRMELAGPFRH